jgi:hypothetical protein
MSREVVVHIIQPNPPSGPQFGQVDDPADFLAAQTYQREHIEAITRELLVRGASAGQCYGLNATLAGGMNVTISPGVAVDQAGKLYDSIPATATTLELASGGAQPRIDLIYAQLQADVAAVNELRPFVRLRTAQEIQDGVYYAPQQFDQPTERHTRIVLAVRQGSPSANPVAPAAGANEVPLWRVTVPANATLLQQGNLADARPLLRSLHSVFATLDGLAAQINPAILAETISDRVAATLVSGSGINLSWNDEESELVISGVMATNAAPGLMSATQFIKLGTGNSVPIAGTFLRCKTNGESIWEPLDSGSVIAGLGYTPANKNGDTLVGNWQVTGDMRLTGLNYTQPADQQISQTLFLFEGQPNSYAREGSTSVFEQTVKMTASLDRNPNVTILTIADVSAGTPQAPFGYMAKFIGRQGVVAFAARGDNLVTFGGDVTVAGSLAKGSGTFLIDHPVGALRSTHKLRHGFIEGPRYDLIYRGRVNLNAGQAVVNLDELFGMTPGTFAALTQNLDGFAWSVDGFTPVRVASIIGAEVTLIAADSNSNETVGFCVFGERSDPHILASETTDIEGRLITEFISTEAQ